MQKLPNNINNENKYGTTTSGNYNDGTIKLTKSGTTSKEEENNNENDNRIRESKREKENTNDNLTYTTANASASISFNSNSVVSPVGEPARENSAGEKKFGTLVNKLIIKYYMFGIWINKWWRI